MQKESLEHIVADLIKLTKQEPGPGLAKLDAGAIPPKCAELVAQNLEANISLSPECEEEIEECVNSSMDGSDLKVDPTLSHCMVAAIIALWMQNTSKQEQGKRRQWAIFKGKVFKASQCVLSKDNPKSTAVSARAISDPTRWNLRVGFVRRVWEHPDSEKLWCEEIDIGEEAPRQIASGLRAFVRKEDLEGRKVVVLANLKAKSLGGFESHGMVICASNSDHTHVELLTVPDGACIGDQIHFEGLTGEPDEVLKAKKNADSVSAVIETLHTDAEKIACSSGHKMIIKGAYVFAPTLANAHVS